MPRFSFSLFRIITVLFVLAGIDTATPDPSRSQVTRADSAAVLLNAAEAFQEQGRGEVAEALYRFIVQRYGDTWAGTRASEALLAAPAEGPDRNTQVELTVWATTFGAWLGVAIPGAFGADDPGPYGAGLLLGGPAGFFAGRAMARSRPYTPGQVRAITFGSFWGTWQGFGLMEILDLGQEEVCHLDLCTIEGPDGPDVFKAMVLGGLAGTVGGAILARKPIPAGVATAATLGASWGSWFGLAGGILADLEGDGLLASTLLAGDAALLGAALLAPGWNLSRNRARMISIAGVIGGLAGAGLDLLIQPDDEKVAIGVPLVGSIAGLAIGANLTSDMDQGSWGPRTGSTNSGGGEEMGGPLISLREGRWSVGVPMPFPAVHALERPNGIKFRTALGVTLFDSRF